MRKIYIDGGTRNNEVCLIDQNVIIVKKKKGLLTNNELEYLALLHALQYIKKFHPSEEVMIYSDSKLIVNQLIGSWKIKEQRLYILNYRIKKILSKNLRVGLTWCPREHNLAGIYLESLKDK